jgi:hypothetical protein
MAGEAQRVPMTDYLLSVNRNSESPQEPPGVPLRTAAVQLPEDGAVDALILSTPNSRRIVLFEDEEVFGHYLMRKLSLRLPRQRHEGSVFAFKLTSFQLSELQELLSALDLKALDQGVLTELAEEFSLGAGWPEGMVAWFADPGNDRRLEERRKLDTFVSDAIAGTSELLLIHKEEW